MAACRADAEKDEAGGTTGSLIETGIGKKIQKGLQRTMRVGRWQDIRRRRPQRHGDWNEMRSATHENLNRSNQVVERTAAPRVFDEGGSSRAAFAHYRRWPL